MNELKSELARDPWYKTTLHFKSPGIDLAFQIPHEVFSTQRIDEGTLLLLDHLAKSEPRAILDMGCGYGALGLPIAARFLQATVEMVDRDLLAVKWSARNAQENKLHQVIAHGSLGFRDIDPAATYDWILCNVPARIGRPFIQNLVQAGRARLRENGDLRLVVINDLLPMFEELKNEFHWPMQEIVRGPRHTVIAFTAPSASEKKNFFSVLTSEELYFRDRVEINALSLARPFDLGGDDPKRLKSGWPVLFDVLPRDPRTKFTKILCFRAGYGVLPLVARKRWPDAYVIAVDRDLLATTFTQENAEALDLAGAKLEIREAAHFPDSFAAGEKFSLIVGELSPSAEEAVAIAEVKAISESLERGGQAYLLCLDNVEKRWIRPFATRTGFTIPALLKRDGYTVLHLGQ